MTDLVDRLAGRIASPEWTWSSTLMLGLLLLIIGIDLAGMLLAAHGFNR